MEYYTAERRTPTLRNSMDGSGEHYAIEISQAMKDKWQVISPITGTKSTKQTSK